MATRDFRAKKQSDQQTHTHTLRFFLLTKDEAKEYGNGILDLAKPPVPGAYPARLEGELGVEKVQREVGDHRNLEEGKQDRRVFTSGRVVPVHADIGIPEILEEMVFGGKIESFSVGEIEATPVL